MNHKCLIHKLVFLTPAFASAAILASFIPKFAGDGLPQRNNGDPLGVLLGDVRMLVSNKMLGKADQYFHGGVTKVENCSNGDGLFHGDHEHHHHDGDVEIHGYGPAVQRHSERAIHPPYDPWATLKAAVRLPNEDRHLNNETSRELLPWFWAAIKLDPHNKNAYLNAAYILRTAHDMPGKALEILDAGLAALPKSADIEFAKGLLLATDLKRPDDAMDSFRNTIADLEGMEDEDSLLLKVRTYGIMGKIASDRGDTATVRDCYEKSSAIMPNHASTKALQSLL